MPSKSPSVQTPAQTNNSPVQFTAANITLAAIDATCICMYGFDDLRAILKAIHGLAQQSDKSEVIGNLARVGINIADDMHNQIDCEHEEFEKKLIALKGGCHA